MKKKSRHILPVFILIAAFIACSEKKNAPAFLQARDAVLLNQLIYKENFTKALSEYAPDYEVVFLPEAVDGNLGVIVKSKNAEQYAVVIRGSVLEFTEEGFQNFFLQDFNVFTIKPWSYADTIKEAYISNGTFTGFQNLLQLKDGQTGLGIKEFIEQKIPEAASIIVTGHSLGGNLAYPLAGYLKKELQAKNKNNLQLITFGAPAAGNAAFVQDMEEKFPLAERYVTDKDIAAAFPDIDRIGDMAKMLGMDSSLQLGSVNISRAALKLDAGTLLGLAGDVLEGTGVINRTNKYVQSERHLRLLKVKDDLPIVSAAIADSFFSRAYRFHRIDTYADLLGVKTGD